MVSAIPTWAVVASLTLAVWLAAPAGAMAAQDVANQPVDALRTAINAYDVESSCNLFADDAVVIQPRIGGLPQIYLGQDQIRWWLRNLVAQHVHWSVAQPARLVGTQNVQWSDILSVDAFRQLGLESIEVKSEAVLASDGRIAALTTVLTPAAARSVELAPGVATPGDAADATPASTVLAAELLLGLGFGGGALTMQFVNRRREPPLSAAERLVASRN